MSTIGIVLLSGCGNSGKKLVCTYDYTDDGASRLEYILNFDNKGEKISVYNQIGIQAYDDSIENEEFEKEFESASKGCDNYKDMKGVKCDVSKDKKTIRVDLKVTLADLDSSGKESLSTAMLDDFSYDEMKEKMEGSGFTCK